MLIKNVGKDSTSILNRYLYNCITLLARYEHILKEVSLLEILGEHRQDVNHLLFDDLIGEVHEALGQNQA